jgi:hypothetical protein
MISFISLPQQQGAFSTFRLTSPVVETSNSRRFLHPQTTHSNIGILEPQLKQEKKA